MTVLLLRVATRPFASLAALGGARSEAAGRVRLAAEARVADGVARLTGALHAAAGPKVDGADDGAARTRLALLAIKRAIHNRREWSAPPGLPAGLEQALDEHRVHLAAAAEATAAWEQALQADLHDGLRAVIAISGEPSVALGIALAARPLISKISSLAGSDPASWGHGDRHVAAKALAYIARFATKTSPNSVFCATALARAVGEDVVATGAPGLRRTDVILSVAESRKVACVLAADPAVEAAIVPRPNPTLRAEDGKLTFWRYASPRNPTDKEALARAKEHPVATAVLAACAPGVTLPELRRRVAQGCALDESALDPFLRQMIESGLLLAEIEIPYNERRPLRFVATRAQDAGCVAPWIEPALAVELAVDAIALHAPSEQARAMARVATELTALPRVREIATDELFRVDAAAGVDLTIPASVIDELRSGLRPYTRLFAALYPARRQRQRWIDRFLARFPADTDVELVDVYRSMTEEGEASRPPAFPAPSGARAELLATVRDHVATSSDGDPVTLDDATLDRLVPGLPEPRWACGVLFQIAAAGPERIARGEYLLALNGLFHGAGLSLSRFAWLLGGERADLANPIVQELKRAWSVVERPGAIVAELTYNHMARTANAGLRPAIFEHEIELPGDCASPSAKALGLRELSVRFDGASLRFTLRRTLDGTEVIPVINSGVNPVGFVSFLVAIGEQDLQPIGYFPGFDDPAVTHWPRVMAGRLVLFRERWVFRRGEWPEGRSFAASVLAWRDRWRLPRHVFVHSSKEPKPRYVDLASPVFVDLMRRDVAALASESDATLHVTEMFPGPGDLFLKEGREGYASELLAQLHGGPVGSSA